MKKDFETWVATHYDILEFYKLPEYFRNLIKIGWINTFFKVYIRIDQAVPSIEMYNGIVHYGDEIIHFFATTPEKLAAGAIERFEELYEDQKHLAPPLETILKTNRP